MSQIVLPQFDQRDQVQRFGIVHIEPTGMRQRTVRSRDVRTSTRVSPSWAAAAAARLLSVSGRLRSAEIMISAFV